MEAPRYVVTTGDDAVAVLRSLARAGWRPRQGFTLPPVVDLGVARLVLFGRVAAHATARPAVTAAVRGAGVVAVADVASPAGRTLLTDLGRLGPVTDRAVPVRAVDQLTGEQRRLLERLAAGETIAGAAAAEFLSLRTANRRIAEVRALYGARSTREAVDAYLRGEQG